MQYSLVQYSATQFNTMQYATLMHNAMKCNAVPSLLKSNECYFLLTISFFPNNCIPVLLPPPQVKELIDAMDQDLKKAAQSSSALEAAAYQVTTIQLTNTHTHSHTLAHK